MPKRKAQTYIVEDEKGEDFAVSEEVLKSVFNTLQAYIQHFSPSSNSDCSRSDAKLVDFAHDGDEENQDFKTRQLASVAYFLRRAILKHRWKEAVHLTLLLCHPGLLMYKSTIINTCFLLLINHPKSSPELLEKFVRKCTGYVVPEEIKKFIKIIFAIREEPLPPVDVGKYVRKTKTFKIVDEMYFKDL